VNLKSTVLAFSVKALLFSSENDNIFVYKTVTSMRRRWLRLFCELALSEGSGAVHNLVSEDLRRIDGVPPYFYFGSSVIPGLVRPIRMLHLSRKSGLDSVTRRVTRNGSWWSRWICFPSIQVFRRIYSEIKSKNSRQDG